MERKGNFMNWADPGTTLMVGASAGIGKEFAYFWRKTHCHQA